MSQVPTVLAHPLPEPREVGDYDPALQVEKLRPREAAHSHAAKTRAPTCGPNHCPEALPSCVSGADLEDPLTPGQHGPRPRLPGLPWPQGAARTHSE